MKQTVQEVAKEMCEAWGMEDNHGYSVKDTYQVGFVQGANWQAEQSPWISVEERLPEEEKEVLVLYEFRSVFMIQEDFYFGQGERWNWGGNKILAWMYIPSFDEILKANKDVLERIKEKGDLIWKIEKS